MGIFGAGLRSPITESLRRQPQSLNPQVFARRQEMTLKPQRRTVGRVLADLVTPRTREGAQWARKISGALDWTSPTGADQPAQDAVAEFKKGNYGTSGLLGVLAAASLVPGVGAEAKTGKGLLGKFVEAYHGSPHKFDRFSLDKIGTGEGAQAYGHGLYFAENEDVAREYRQRLANITASEFDKIGIPPSKWNAATMFARQTDPKLPEVAARDFSAWTGEPVTKDLVDAYRKTMANSGHMYKVKINADPEHFLNWDVPLNQQSENVRAAANKIFDPGWDGSASWAQGWNPTGGDLVGPHRGQEGIRRASILRDSGVPGVTYLDQGSRSSGLGTRNHVVFDDSLIEILKRYGIVPPALVGGMAAQQQNQMPQ